MMPDGTEKALVAKDGAVAEPHVGGVAEGEQGGQDGQLIPVENITISFDLKVHSAAAMVASLGARGSAAVRKRNDGGWPVSVAEGGRPTGEPKRPAPPARRQARVARAALQLPQRRLRDHGGARRRPSTSFRASSSSTWSEEVAQAARYGTAGQRLGMPFSSASTSPTTGSSLTSTGLITTAARRRHADLELTWQDVATMRPPVARLWLLCRRALPRPQDDGEQRPVRYRAAHPLR